MPVDIWTNSDFVSAVDDHRLSGWYHVLRYADGALSCFPKAFFVGGAGPSVPEGALHIGKGSSLGYGSTVKIDFGCQTLRVGRFVQGGWNIRFILNGAHPMRTISIHSMGFAGLDKIKGEIFDETRIGNDVWIGDEAMFLSGVTVGDGCVVGARSLVTQNAVLEPYGIYAGSPARLIRFRFPPPVIELLLRIRWWARPLSFIREHFDHFRLDLLTDIDGSIAALSGLARAAEACGEDPAVTDEPVLACSVHNP